MEVSGYDGKKVIWRVVYNIVIEELKDIDEVGLQISYYNCFGEDEGGR